MRIITLLSYLFLCSLFCACSSESEMVERPNIIWINAEDISPAWGCYGDTYATTPYLDQLAQKSVLYRNAFASAPICAPARSCLVTGMYATSLGTQHLRSETPRAEEIVTLPQYLRQAGYFTTLYGKTDYNFDAEGLWDLREQDEAPWRQTPEGQPFFSMFTFGMTHEGRGNLPERYQEAVAELPNELFHDPANAPVPPYYPDTPETRQLWARYYDLVTVFDRKVEQILSTLEADGLMENTIVFVFSDHGFGMPRYKRWLNETGLKVPLVVHIPEKFQYLANGNNPGTENTQLVSFVDFAPTALSLAGVDIPSHMQGKSFLGETVAEPREYIYGARSRADDMYEVSRAVRNDRYIYIRHYMPHLPYIQPGYIFSDRKESFRILRQLRKEGKLHEQAEKLWNPKPIEELYDLQEDPQELHNLAASPEHQQIKTQLHNQLKDWILDMRDVGFLHEAEMMIRSENSTPYDMAQDTAQYDLPRILEAAEMVGTASAPELAEKLKDPDSGVRFWAAIGLQALGKEAILQEENTLQAALDDPSPSVQIVAAESLCEAGKTEKALPVLAERVKDDRKWVALQAARSIEMIGEAAEPLVPTIREVLEKYLGPPGRDLKYIDFNYAAFISWPLEMSLQNLGEPLP